MTLTKCRYCEHGNPPDSKYCNACGATLTLAPCPHCGAVNQITATTCYQCRGGLQESSKDALVPALPAAAISKPSLRQPSFAIVGTVVVAIVALIGYYAYRDYSLVSAPASGPGFAAAPPVPVTATPASAGPPAGPTEAAAVAAPVERPQAIKKKEAAAGRAALAPSRKSTGGEPCTEGVAALGLCAPKSK